MTPQIHKLENQARQKPTHDAALAALDVLGWSWDADESKAIPKSGAGASHTVTPSATPSASPLIPLMGPSQESPQSAKVAPGTFSAGPELPTDEEMARIKAELDEADKVANPPPPVDPDILERDDVTGRAKRFRDECYPHLLRTQGNFIDYDAARGRYVEISDDDMRQRAWNWHDTKKRYQGRGKNIALVAYGPGPKDIDDMLDALGARVHVLDEVTLPYWRDGRSGPDPKNLIAFRNGILNWRTMKFMDATPMLVTLRAVALDYDPQAKMPRQWLRFLLQVYGGEKEQIRSLQEAIGYTLTPDTSQEKAFLVVGPKRSGKDVQRETIMALLGNDSVAGPTLDSLATDFGMSVCINKPLIVIGDARIGSKTNKEQLAEHVLKITGRSLFSINRKFKSFWSGVLDSKLWIITNDRPELRDASGALASRFINYETRVSFFGREFIGLFKIKIAPELSGIMLWALAGLQRVNERGRIIESRHSVGTRHQLEIEGSPVLAFVRECLTIDPHGSVPKDKLFERFEDYVEANGLRPMSLPWFIRNLSSATGGKTEPGRVRVEGARQHLIYGVRFKTPADAGAML